MDLSSSPQGTCRGDFKVDDETGGAGAIACRGDTVTIRLETRCNRDASAAALDEAWSKARRHVMKQMCRNQ